MKLVKLLVLILILAGLYFGYLRDRVIEYPIQTTLVNNEGEKLPVTLQGRNNRFVQFTKAGSTLSYDYPVQKLNMLSKAKLAFLPKKQASSDSSFGGNANQTSKETVSMHLKGMQAEMSEYDTRLRLLMSEYESKATKAERGQVKHEIDLLKIQIKELQFKMETFIARSM